MILFRCWWNHRLSFWAAFKGVLASGLNSDSRSAGWDADMFRLVPGMYVEDLPLL